eukprot:TRINITY_DN5229_c0_g1_i3.p1 TRINITY_DN5229_c0_g1~~TRINITY_DN5229_c0_g1_i3.p1  ORF type:complete len:256 (-),score=69.50 TRINITY_DN5229_c0_g1_i3:32-799(-)
MELPNPELKREESTEEGVRDTLRFTSKEISENNFKDLSQIKPPPSFSPFVRACSNSSTLSDLMNKDALKAGEINVATSWINTFTGTQCSHPSVKHIQFYGQGDTTVGHWLINRAFNTRAKCDGCRSTSRSGPPCLTHRRLFLHANNCIVVAVRKQKPNNLQKRSRIPMNVPASVLDSSIPSHNDHNHHHQPEMKKKNSIDSTLRVWTWCHDCECAQTIASPFPRQAAQYSFGRFLQLWFYGKGFMECGHSWFYII